MNQAHVHVHVTKNSPYAEITVKGASTKNRGLTLIKLRVSTKELLEALGPYGYTPHPADSTMGAEIIH